MPSGACVRWQKTGSVHSLHTDVHEPPVSAGSGLANRSQQASAMAYRSCVAMTGTMPYMRLAQINLALLLIGLAAGCANLNQAPRQPRAKAATDHAKAPDLSKQRLMLSEGYSMLYKDAGSLDASDLILYVKAESEA